MLAYRGPATDAFQFSKVAHNANLLAFVMVYVARAQCCKGWLGCAW